MGLLSHSTVKESNLKYIFRYSTRQFQFRSVPLTEQSLLAHKKYLFAKGSRRSTSQNENIHNLTGLFYRILFIFRNFKPSFEYLRRSGVPSEIFANMISSISNSISLASRDF